MHRWKQNFKFHKQKTASDSGEVLHYERQDGGFEVGSSSTTVSLRDYKIFAYFNAETKEKSSGTYVNMLFKAGKKIQWKVIDADYCLFADGELQMPEARSMPS